MASTKLLRNEKLRAITVERAEKFISKDYWNDVNLYSKLYKQRLPEAVTFSVFSVEGTDACNTDKLSFAEAIQQKFTPAKLGTSYGPSWGTHWFKVKIKVPESVVGEEVHLLWDNGSEALVYVDGIPAQSLYGGNGDDRREEFLLSKNSKGGETYELYIEMACNGMFGNPGPGSFLKPPVDDLTFTHSKAEVGVLNRDAWHLFWDLDILIGMAKELPEESNRSWQAVSAVERICNTCWPDDPSTFPPALEIAAEFLGKKSGLSEHQITACGHCHIDTAWLWTYSETRRKCARSWSNQLTLMKEFPNYVFAASQAQQFDWLKEKYPKLLQQIKEQPRFIPTGGTWVEMDCNIPSGESFIRQFLYGQRFFKKEFGKHCTEFWLPDTFGYSAQLPQIIKGAEMEFFLTQKLSWNLINKFPHSSFLWQGLDGTQVLCHFPPADTYCSSSSVKDLTFTVKNHKNKDTSNQSMLLFGFGDGGGGPTRPLLERLKRVENTDGMPNLTYQAPVNFFKTLKAEGKHAVWVGELYFELHRGTYTTHALVKRSNRKNEFLLANVEILSSLASLSNPKFVYQHDEIERLWKLLLLNQFHDVIPGTSIPPVYKDAHKFYAEIDKIGNSLLLSALENCNATEHSAAPGSCIVVNPLAWERKEVIQLPSNVKGSQESGNPLEEKGSSLAVVDAPSMGWNESKPISDAKHEKVTIEKEGTGFVLENSFIRAKIEKSGLVSSLIHKETGRESIGTNPEAPFGNQFMMFEDIPFYWDAWDVMIYHQHKYRFITEAASISIVESGPIRVGLFVEIKISDVSTIKQFISLDCTEQHLVFDTQVDWHENRKFLKVQFPVNVLTGVASYSIQFGHAARPTHTNTSWDAAKFEVCGHHWADLSEHGFGVALLNDCKYGYSCHNNIMRLSLLRSSKMPDDTADMGLHRFKYAIHPHKGDHLKANLTRVGYNFNQPLIVKEVKQTHKEKSAFSVKNKNLFIECLKIAEEPLDGSKAGKALILRAWEGFGGRGRGVIKSDLPIKSVESCNLLENPTDNHAVTWKDGALEFDFMPFQILSFKLHF